MVAPWEAQTGAKVKYTGTRDLNTVLTTGVASGVLPDLAGLPGPGQMAEYAADASEDARRRPRRQDLHVRDARPALVTLGQVDGKQVGVFIKTAVKGLIWFDPKVLTTTAAAPPATWDALQTLDHGEPEQGQVAVVPRRRERRRVRLAGHRLDRGHRPPPGRSRRLPAAGTRARSSGPIRRSRPRGPRSVTSSQNTFGGSRDGRSPRTSPTPATRSSRPRPAACSCTRRASSPASARSRPRRPGPTTTSSSSRHQRAVHRRGRRRRRPVRHVPRHPRGRRP